MLLRDDNMKHFKDIDPQIQGHDVLIERLTYPVRIL
jgi:hypothetical protein